MRDGIKFDSKRESERFGELQLLLKAGKIRNLKLQPSFTLQEAFTTPEGEHIRAITYKADFSYEAPVCDAEDGEMLWLPVVEDVKGMKTKEYLLKYKMMAERGVKVVEICKSS